MFFNLFKKNTLLTIMLGICLLTSINSHAGLINVDIFKEADDSVIDNSDPFSLAFNKLARSSSDVNITFTVFGDFSNSNEWIDLSANSHSFGRWLNHTNIDDSILGPGISDTGNEYKDYIVGRTTLSAGDFNNLFKGDNEVVFLFDYNRSDGNSQGVLSFVNNLLAGDYAKVELNYTADSPQAATSVPEPSESIMLIMGLTGLFLLKRRQLVVHEKQINCKTSDLI